MTIIGLNDFLKKKLGNTFRGVVSIKNFTGKRIAIDGNMWSHKNIYISFLKEIRDMPNPFEEINRKNVMNTFMESLISFVTALMGDGLTPIFVWDGESYPEKKKTQNYRKSGKEKLLERLTELDAELRPMSFMKRPAQKVAEYRMLLSQTSRFDPGEITFFIEFLRNIGIPSIKAPHEAEETCAGLANFGKVMGVWTTDSDAYAMGIPIIIKERRRKDKEIYFSVDYSFAILKELEMDEDQFRDFCIMCGTDFNEKIPKYGPVKCYTLLKKYGFDIEKCERNTPEIDFRVLNLERVREIFSPQKPMYPVSKLNINFDKIENNGRDIFNFYGIIEKWENFLEIARRCHSYGVSDFSFEEIPDLEKDDESTEVEEN